MSSRAMLAVWLVAVFAVASCSPKPRIARASNVAEIRLDVVEAALERAEQTEGGTVSANLKEALTAARKALSTARDAATTWSNGDDSKWKAITPELRQRLVAVEDAMIAMKLPVPPGLVEGMTAATPCCGGDAGGH